MGLKVVGRPVNRVEGPEKVGGKTVYTADVQLPGMSGLEVTQSLKSDADTRDIPIIVTTAYGLDDADAQLRASGCDGYMAKPIAISEFLALVESFMRRPAGAAQYA